MTSHEISRAQHRDRVWYRAQFSVAILALTIALASAMGMFNLALVTSHRTTGTQFFEHLLLVMTMLGLAVFSGFSAARFYFSPEPNSSEYAAAAEQWQTAMGLNGTLEKTPSHSWNSGLFARAIVLGGAIVACDGFSNDFLRGYLGLTMEHAWLILSCVGLAFLGTGWLGLCGAAGRIGILAADLGMIMIGLWLAVVCQIQWISTAVSVGAWAMLSITSWCVIATEYDGTRIVNQAAARKEPTISLDSNLP